MTTLNRTYFFFSFLSTLTFDYYSFKKKNRIIRTRGYGRGPC